jgi:CRISPR-associated protein Csb2
MFAIGVEFLMRRAIITRWGNWERPEWPPHPDRLFMALVAAWGESGEDTDQLAALEWLERQPSPAICASEVASERTPFTSYVPVNDDSNPNGKNGPFGPMGGVPIGRNRQPRRFPAVVPESPIYYLRWESDIPLAVRTRLESLCGLVTYVGHSASPVRVWVEDSPPEPDFVPCEEKASFRVRGVAHGRTAYLKNRYYAGLRPQPSIWHGYATAENRSSQDYDESPFDADLIVLRQAAGRRFGLESCGIVAETMRDTLMERYGADAPEWISGHAPEGGPSQKIRPAYIPLGFVDHEHADGRLLGVAIAMPRDFKDANRLSSLLENHHEPEHEGVAYLALGVKGSRHGARVVGNLDLELDTRPERQRQVTLQTFRWTAPALRWVSVTPIILPRYPRRKLAAEEIVARACVQAGYPEPSAVRTSPAPMLRGVPHSRSFNVVPHDGCPPRKWMHAEIEFVRPLRGPLLLGAGRYRGYGVCFPHSGEDKP